MVLASVLVILSCLSLSTAQSLAQTAREAAGEPAQAEPQSATTQNTPPPSEPSVAAGDGTVLPPVQSHILTVDRERLFTQSMYGRRILAELETERSRLAAEARKVDADLVAEEKNLTDQRAKLSPDAFRLLADAFDEKVQALRRERPAREKDFSDRFEREQQAFFQKIGPILGVVVRERGGVVIVDRRAILLTTQNIDITDHAIARIDVVLGDGLQRQDSQPDPEAGNQ